MNLMTSIDVRRLLNISINILTKYRRRPDFPRPAMMVGVAPLWNAEDVLTWAGLPADATDESLLGVSEARKLVGLNKDAFEKLARGRLKPAVTIQHDKVATRRWRRCDLTVETTAA